MVTNSYNFWNDLLSGMHKVTHFNYSTRQGTATLDFIQHIGTRLTEDQKRSTTKLMERGKTGSSGGSAVPTICRCSVNRFLRCPQAIGTVVHAILTEWSGPTHLPKIVTEQVDVLPSKTRHYTS